jgi:hypothetical protein
MCKAHVLRFCCGHGILMDLEICRSVPCIFLKLTSNPKLPQQPFKCYNCQSKGTNLRIVTEAEPSCTSSASVTSASSSGSISPPTSPTTPSPISRQRSYASPLPGVARQPSECGDLGKRYSRQQSFSAKAFRFACNGSGHHATPHYSALPNFLPHQDHDCPPCRLQEARMKGDREVIAAANREFPHLTGEMLVSDGRRWEEWMKMDWVSQDNRDDRKAIFWDGIIGLGRAWTWLCWRW